MWVALNLVLSLLHFDLDLKQLDLDLDLAKPPK